MKKNILTIVLGSLAGVFLIALLVSCTSSKSLGSTNYVVVEDSLYSKFFNPTQDFGTDDFNFISLSDFYTPSDDEKKSDKRIVAHIDLKKSFGSQNQSDSIDLAKDYFIEENVLIPSIPVDFENPLSLDSPNLNLSLTSSVDLPSGNRGLPVDGKYAGDSGYSLTEISLAHCTLFEPLYQEEFFNICSQVFEKKSEDKKTIFVASVGDIMVERGVQEILMEQKDGLEKVFGKTLPILQSNDITIGNLEGVVTELKDAAAKTYVFKFHKEVLPELKKAGFNYFMQTNNHCYDYKEEGFKDTLAALKEYDIPTSGAGYNGEEAKKFYHKEINGTNFAIISCGDYPVEWSGFNGETMASATENRAGILWMNDGLFDDIAKEKAAGNFVIVNVHGGVEYSKTPSKHQRETYEKMIDSGADLILGSHPHVLQPTEWYKGKLIVYSMGNFIFNQMENMASFGALETEVVRFGIVDGKIVYTEIYPAKINGCSVDLKRK